MSKQLAFVPDDRMNDAPDLPTDRPPTRREVWDYVRHYYHDTKTHEGQVAFAQRLFIGNYAYWVNKYGWRKHPDWNGEEPVIEAACPTGPMLPGETATITLKLMEIVKKRRPG